MGPRPSGVTLYGVDTVYSHSAERRATLTAMPAHEPAALGRPFPTEHRLCRPGLVEPDVTDKRIAFWCECGASIVAELPLLPA